LVSVIPETPALYQGVVSHRRRAPVANRFHYPAGYWLVDYDQLPQPSGWVRAIAGVRRCDHVDVRPMLAERGIAASRIVLLTTPRSLGYVFNPISIFWCYDEAGQSTASLAEVHNTYGGRHVYVLTGEDQHRVDKALYVSPFYPVDGQYRIEISEPGPTVNVTVVLEREGEAPFVATLNAARRPLNGLGMIWQALRYSGLRTSLLIRRQALTLWRRGLKIVPR
jgi:uncharacterized protein